MFAYNKCEICITEIRLELAKQASIKIPFKKQLLGCADYRKWNAIYLINLVECEWWSSTLLLIMLIDSKERNLINTGSHLLSWDSKILSEDRSTVS